MKFVKAGPLLILLAVETVKELLSVPHIIPLSVMVAALLNSPPETTEVELIVVTGLVIINGGSGKGSGGVSEFFLQLKTNPITKIETIIVKMLIDLMQSCLSQDKTVLIYWY